VLSYKHSAEIRVEVELIDVDVEVVESVVYQVAGGTIE
jgi:hypothetical protein